MEGHNTQLEADPSDSEHDSSKEHRESRPVRGDFADTRELHGPGLGVNEGHAEEKECGGGRSQNQIFDSGFECAFAFFQVRNHGVQRDA